MAEELWHHGIKGQKWGVRRYQNEDGSLTDAGIKRYAIKGYSEDSYNSGNRAQKVWDKITNGHKYAGDAMYGASSKKENEARARKYLKDHPNERITKAHKDYLSAHNSKSVKTMSDAELRTRLNRMNMEKQYSQMNPTRVERGRKALSTTVKAVGTVAAASTTVITVKNNWNTISGWFKKS